MGFTTDLKELFHFIYKAQLDNGLSEHELDYVLIGHYDGQPSINKDEVCDWKWENIDFLKKDLVDRPSIYTAWFKIIFEKFYNSIKNESNS